MKISAFPSAPKNSIQKLSITGVDFTTAQTIPCDFLAKNVRIRILNVAIISTSVASLSAGAVVRLQETDRSVFTAAESLSSSDEDGQRQEIPVLQTNQDTALETALVFSITTGSTATTDEKDVEILYQVLD
jgi:hypothetical protein